MDNQQIGNGYDTSRNQREYGDGSSLLPKERLVRVYEVIQETGVGRVASLAAHFGTSPITIRRDLNELERRGLVVRTHGGVIIPKGILVDYDVSIRQQAHVDLKRSITRSALQFIEPGDIIALDASTTVVELAKWLVEEHFDDLTVVTNNFMVASVLMSSPIEVYFAGGHRRREALSTVGHAAEAMLSHWVFDKVFISVTAVNIASGAMDGDTEEVRVKRLMLRNSSKRYVLADSSKLMKRAARRVCSIADCDALVTDEFADRVIVEDFERANVRIVVADVSDAKSEASGS